MCSLPLAESTAVSSVLSLRRRKMKMFFQHANDDDDSLTLLILHLHTCVHETEKVQGARSLELILRCSSQLVGYACALSLEAQPPVLTIWLRLVAPQVTKLPPVQWIEYQDRRSFLIFSIFNQCWQATNSGQFLEMFDLTWNVLKASLIHVVVGFLRAQCVSRTSLPHASTVLRLFKLL